MKLDMARGEGTGSLWGIASYYARYLSLLTLFAPSVRGESFFNEGYGVDENASEPASVRAKRE